MTQPTTHLPLILASNSPRRRDLLATLGLAFDVIPGPDLDEAAVMAAVGGSVQQRLEALALRKGEAVAAQHPSALVLSADTAVVLGKRVMGKPRDIDDAREMLITLSGRTHEVITAVAVRHHAGARQAAASETTRVCFHALSMDTINAYVARVNPLDYAGSYAIQGLGALLVAQVKGDYSNVVGLPLGLTARLLEDAGLKVL